MFVIVNGNSLDDARKKRDDIDMLFVENSNRECDPHLQQAKDCQSRQEAAYKKVNDLETQRTIGLIGLGVGAAAMVTGAVLLITNDSPHKYDRPESEVAIAPLGWIDGNGVRLGLQARF